MSPDISTKKVSGKAEASIRLPNKIRLQLIAILFVLPCTIVLVMMMFNPLIQTVEFSFSKIILPKFETHFIGIDNFVRVFSRPEVGLVLKNTFVWIIGTVALRFFLGFGAAIIMNSDVKGINVFRLIALLPWTVPSIVAANTWRWMLQGDFGLINGFLKEFGMGGLAHNWLGSSSTAIFSVLFAYSWAGYPFVMIMLLAGMQGIPKELYESGNIDGANAWQLFWYITVPSLKSVIFIILILEIISGFNSFDLLYTMTGGGPGGSSEILGLFIYRLGFTNFDFAGASAVSVVLIFMALLCFLFYGPSQARKKRMG